MCCRLHFGILLGFLWQKYIQNKIWRERNATQAWKEPISGSHVSHGALPDVMLCPPLQSLCTSNCSSNDKWSLEFSLPWSCIILTVICVRSVNIPVNSTSPTFEKKCWWNSYRSLLSLFGTCFQISKKAIIRTRLNVNQTVNYGTTRRPWAGWDLQAVCISYCTTDEAMWHLVCGPAAASGLQRLSSPTNEDGERGQRW